MSIVDSPSDKDVDDALASDRDDRDGQDTFTYNAAVNAGEHAEERGQVEAPNTPERDRIDDNTI